MSRVLIAGSNGFLGVNACLKFLNEGYEVLGVDNNYTGTSRNLENLQNFKGFKYLDFDIRENWKSIPKVDLVVNLACPASPLHYQKDPIFTWTTSTLGNLNAVNFCKELSIPLVFSSTSEVYGDPLTTLQTEDYWGNVNPIGIRSCYDEGKRSAESLLFDSKRFYNLDVRVMRIFNTYGPGMSPGDGRVVSNFIVQALAGDPLTIYGDGKQTRSFCFVSDTIDALFGISAPNFRSDTPLNIGNPDEITMLTLAETILDLTESKSDLQFSELPQDDPKIRRPDISRARKQLHWDPKINLREGLEKTIAYFQDIQSAL
jgi:UDP-glucuronate decarboxylase